MSRIRLLVGTRTLRDIVLGRYHQARIEERFFLFVDIVGSTALAENTPAHDVVTLLNAFFRVVVEVIGQFLTGSSTWAEGRCQRDPPGLWGR